MRHEAISTCFTWKLDRFPPKKGYEAHRRDPPERHVSRLTSNGTIYARAHWGQRNRLIAILGPLPLPSIVIICDANVDV